MMEWIKVMQNTTCSLINSQRAVNKEGHAQVKESSVPKGPSLLVKLQELDEKNHYCVDCDAKGYSSLPFLFILFLLFLLSSVLSSSRSQLGIDQLGSSDLFGVFRCSSKFGCTSVTSAFFDFGRFGSRDSHFNGEDWKPQGKRHLRVLVASRSGKAKPKVVKVAHSLTH
jgi:hypothetical protein